MPFEDAVIVIGGLFGCWVLGYGSAYLIKVIKQASEKI